MNNFKSFKINITHNQLENFSQNVNFRPDYKTIRESGKAEKSCRWFFIAISHEVVQPFMRGECING